MLLQNRIKNVMYEIRDDWICCAFIKFIFIKGTNKFWNSKNTIRITIECNIFNNHGFFLLHLPAEKIPNKNIRNVREMYVVNNKSQDIFILVKEKNKLGIDSQA